jgi:hypothetical protein
MSNAYLCPILQEAQWNDDGTFLVGGLVWFYQAGTTTPVAAYTGPTAATAWSNPIVLDSRGETGGEIWLATGTSYKIVLEEPPIYGQTHGTVVSTFDNISGINDITVSTTQVNWFQYTGAITRVSSTQFNVTGDQSATFQVKRRIKFLDGSGYKYAGIESVSYSSGITTVTIIPDTTGFDPGLSAIYYGFIETNPSSIPVAVQTGTPTSAATDEIFINYAASKLGYYFGSSINSDIWDGSNNPVTLAASGSCNFQNGLQLRWGPFSATAGGATITFSSAFSTGAYAVTISGSAADVHTGTLGSASFVATSATSATGYYIALGH